MGITPRAKQLSRYRVEVDLLTSPEQQISADIILHEQAKLLNQASRGSAFLVMLIIGNVAFLMGISGQFLTAFIWLLVASSLVFATRLYARHRMPQGITIKSARNYIYGHMTLTAITGLTWSAFAIFATDLNSEISLIIASTFLISISLGGLLPGSPHRLDYLVMLSCALLPFPIWIIFNADSPIRYFGFGYIILYIVFFLASRKVHAQTIETIKAKLNEATHTASSKLMISVGHDLAQPLFAQRNYLEVLSRSDKDGTHKEIIAKLTETQSSQEYLLTSLMDYERLKHGAVTPNLQPTNFTELVESILGEFRDIAHAKGIETSVQLDLVLGRTDAEIVKNCIRNVLSNAYKFCPNNSTVSVALSALDDTALINISDTGPGIDPAQCKAVFDPFNRLDTADPSPGLGLGLTSVKENMELLNGEVVLNSAIDHGVEIVFEIPLNTPSK